MQLSVLHRKTPNSMVPLHMALCRVHTYVRLYIAGSVHIREASSIERLRCAVLRGHTEQQCILFVLWRVKFVVFTNWLPSAKVASKKYRHWINGYMCTYVYSILELPATVNSAKCNENSQNLDSTNNACTILMYYTIPTQTALLCCLIQRHTLYVLNLHVLNCYLTACKVSVRVLTGQVVVNGKG